MFGLKHDGSGSDRVPSVNAAVWPWGERLKPNAQFPPHQIPDKVLKIRR